MINRPMHTPRQFANTESALVRRRQVERREWWLWGFAVAVTLVLTFGILSLTFPGFHLATDRVYALNLREWVRGLAALVLCSTSIRYINSFSSSECAANWQSATDSFSSSAKTPRI